MRKEKRSRIRHHIVSNEVPPEIMKRIEDAFPEPLVNFGGAIKRCQALRISAKIAYEMQTGTMESLIDVLTQKLGLTRRRIKEDYVSELPKRGLILTQGSMFTWNPEMPKVGETFMEYVNRKKAESS